jgi:hypothetical protein
MPDVANLAEIPSPARPGFELLVTILTAAAHEELLAITAYGGWLAGDPLFRDEPARSAVVLRRVDVRRLAEIAVQGPRLGKKNIRAPLIMTPEYIRRSADVFPLEFLEIQTLSRTVLGTDYFAPLRFERDNVRLQCEREIKSELLQLNQGLLAAAGNTRRLADFCRAETERVVRVLRGILHMADAPVPALATQILARCVEITQLKLAAVDNVVRGGDVADHSAFERYYDDLVQLATYLDQQPACAAQS